MRKILVTGATGFIGSNLVKALLHQGYTVRAFHRITSNKVTLNDIEVEHFVGELRDKNSLRQAIKGCDTVFHTAALISFFKQKRQNHFEVNVNGTKNVVETCMELDVEKLVHTSTIAAIGYRNDGMLVDETTPYNWGSKIAYRYTKYLAELEVLKAVKNGLNATIVNPTVIIGAGDVHVHGGQLVRDIKRGIIPAYADGGVNIVGIGDVIAGQIAAAKIGRTGERYILGNTNFTHKELFMLIARIVDGKAPIIKAPRWLVLSTAKVFDLFGILTSIEPPLTTDLAASILARTWCSINKAKQELGYEPQPIVTAIREAFEWYQEYGMI